MILSLICYINHHIFFLQLCYRKTQAEAASNLSRQEESAATAACWWCHATCSLREAGSTVYCGNKNDWGRTPQVFSIIWGVLRFKNFWRPCTNYIATAWNNAFSAACCCCCHE